MDQLRRRADRFRKQGRLQDKDLESIIEDMRKEKESTERGTQDGETSRAEEHTRVLEAVEEGLLQTQGTAPNSKQDGIFRILCENANGFNN